MGGRDIQKASGHLSGDIFKLCGCKADGIHGNGVEDKKDYRKCISTVCMAWIMGRSYECRT